MGVAGALLVLAVAVASGGAQSLGEPGASQFRVVWQAEASRALGPVVQGSVYNDWIYPVRHVQLRIQALEGATVKEETYKFVLGDIAPGSRAYFLARVPAAGDYRVSVVSFERIGGGL
jgi:hypothetical protein